MNNGLVAPVNGTLQNKQKHMFVSRVFLRNLEVNQRNREQVSPFACFVLSYFVEQLFEFESFLKLSRICSWSDSVCLNKDIVACVELSKKSIFVIRHHIELTAEKLDGIGSLFVA